MRTRRSVAGSGGGDRTLSLRVQYGLLETNSHAPVMRLIKILFALSAGFAYALARNGERLVEDGLRGTPLLWWMLLSDVCRCYFVEQSCTCLLYTSDAADE